MNTLARVFAAICATGQIGIVTPVSIIRALSPHDEAGCIQDAAKHHGHTQIASCQFGFNGAAAEAVNWLAVAGAASMGAGFGVFALRRLNKKEEIAPS